MKFVGIGVDIESVNRFRKKPFSKNKAFYERIFTKNEISYCLGKADPYPHFAARFCAKEAAIKALRKKIGDYRTIEIRSIRNKPVIKSKHGKISISLAHEKNKAIAFAMVVA